MSGMELTELQDKIGRMCSGLVARVNDHTKRLDRWPEELSQLNQVVAVVNELGRVVAHMRESISAGKEVDQRNMTQQVLAQAFEDVLGAVDLDSNLDDKKVVEPFTFDGRIFAVGEILQFLADSQRSGQVSVEGPQESFVLNLDAGRLVAAYSTNSPPGFRLGEILVRKFGINKDLLAKFLTQGTQGGKPLGRALSDQAVVPQSLVYEALHYQIVRLFERCLALEGASIVYDPVVVECPADGPCLRVADILLKATVPEVNTRPSS